MKYVYSMKIEPFPYVVYATCTPSQAFETLNRLFKKKHGISADYHSVCYTITKHFALKKTKEMPGFSRICFKSVERHPRYFVLQEGLWYSASKVYEPIAEIKEWNKECQK
jgi:hypothetical protein